MRIICFIVVVIITLVLIGCEFTPPEKEQMKLDGIQIAAKYVVTELKLNAQKKLQLKAASEQILYLLQNGKLLQGKHWNIIWAKMRQPNLSAFAQDIFNCFLEETKVNFKKYFSKKDIRYMVAFFSGVRLGAMQ